MRPMTTAGKPGNRGVPVTVTGWIALSLLLATGALGAVQWEPAADITGDRDVRTNGVVRYAYSWKMGNKDSIIVNGVPFVPQGRSGRGGVDVLAPVLNVWDAGRKWSGDEEASEDFSDDYRAILSGVIFNGYGQTATVTLRNLIPGRRYLVQVWCCSVFPEFADQTNVVDGGHAVRTHVGTADDPALGQYITGVFTCSASGEESFTLGAPKWPILNALQVRDLDGEAEIRWEEPQDIVSDSDVRTEGRLVFAYHHNGQSVEVNGVPFTGVPTAQPIPDNQEGLADVVSVGFTGITDSAYGSNGLSGDYAKLVVGGAYLDNGEGGLVIRNLIPGRSYLLQLWVHDSREALGNYRAEEVDGQVILRYRTGTGNGQYLVGRFQATAPTRAIPLKIVPIEGRNGSLQWNAIQLRELNPGGIAWRVEAVAGDESVSTEGRSVFALTYANEAVTVNGVTFQPALGDLSIADEARSVTLEGFEAVNRWADYFPTWESAGASAELHALLAYGIYSQNAREVRLTLNRLVPGGRYQIQLFATDTRPIASRGMIVDGLARTYLSYGLARPIANTAIGSFTASGPEQTIPLAPVAPTGANSDILSTQFQAIQLRRLDPFTADEITWTVTETLDESDVSTEGGLAYAYTYSGNDLIVNGVPFTSASTPEGFGADVTFSQPFGGIHRAFDAGYTGMSVAGAYRTLQGCGAYQDDRLTLAVTFGNLRPGHAYLVQMWTCDLRPGNGTARFWHADGSPRIPYRDGTSGNSWMATGRFLAVGGNKRMTMTFGATQGRFSAQINALQVRDLGLHGEVETVPGGTWSLTADTVKTAPVYCDAPLSIGAPGCPYSFDARGGVIAPESVVEAVWGGTSLLKTGDGTMTLNGAAPVLERIDVSGGTFTFNGTVSRPVLLTVQPGASLSVAEGKALPAVALDGEGRYAGPGEIHLDNPHVENCRAVLTDGVKLVKTGGLDLLLTGPLGGATVKGVAGRVVVAGDQSGAFALAGAIAFDRAWVTGTLTAAEDLTVTGLTLDRGATLHLAGKSVLTAADDLDLDGVIVTAEEVDRQPDKILIRGEGVLAGTPEFRFGKRGYRPYFDAARNAWCVRFDGFLMIVQ